MHNETADHYATLGLDRRCTAVQIRAAYRVLVKQHHPDVNAGSNDAGQSAQRINAAYETLIDPARRRRYDHERRLTETPAPRGKRERNITQDLSLPIKDFFRGASVEVRVKDAANGNAAEVYPLDVPPQTAPGTRFKIARSPEAGGGFIQLRVRALPAFRFKSHGSDLLCELRIDNRLAASGGMAALETPANSRLQIKIPARVKRGETLRIRGEGLPKRLGARGDLLVKITYRPEVRATRR